MVKFQVVPFAFTLILLFWETLSWFLLLQKYGEGRRFSKKNLLTWEIYGRIVLHRGTNDQIIPRGRSF